MVPGMHKRRFFVKKNILAAFLALSSAVANAEKLDYHDRNIADDSIAYSIKSPRPVAVTELIDAIKGKYTTESVEELDISENTICLKGAAQILDFAKTYPSLRRISFASNRIYDSRSEADYQLFEDKLVALLKSTSLEEVDLSSNGIANASWVAYMKNKVAADLMRKVRWAD